MNINLYKYNVTNVNEIQLNCVYVYSKPNKKIILVNSTILLQFPLYMWIFSIFYVQMPHMRTNSQCIDLRFSTLNTY